MAASAAEAYNMLGRSTNGSRDTAGKSLRRVVFLGAELLLEEW